MPKHVVLVGHCGPDANYLRMAVRQADPKANIVGADDQAELSAALANGATLLLINREPGYGFGGSTGIDLIGSLRRPFPQVGLMLISNYPEAQAAAEQAGASKGFGKREIGSPHVVELLRAALTDSIAK